MVRGTKRKIPIEKITKKNSLAVCFTRRRDGLYSKASQICLLSGAQIAILATPSSVESNVSFFSFGHSSIDAVVSAFLTGHRPAPVPEENKQMREDIDICLSRKDLGLGLGFWWDDIKLYGSENPEEVKDAIESMSILLSEFRSVKNRQDFDKDVKKKNVVLHQERKPQDELIQTLNHQSTSDNSNKNTEDNFYLMDNNNKNLLVGNLDEYLNSNEAIDIDELEEILSDKSNCKIPDDCLRTDTEINVLNYDLPEDLKGFANNNTQEQDQIMLNSDNFNLDFEINYDGLLSYDF